MRNLIMICIMTLSIVSVSTAQETGEFGKALKLVQKGDLKGAINIFTDILRDDPSQKDVLLMRAKAKYKAGAYQGTLNDCFAYMEKHGIDDQVAGLLGKTQLAKGNYKQALAYLKVALMFNPTGEEYLLDRGQAYYDLGLDYEACNDWYTAAIDGSKKGTSLSERYCRNFRQKNTPKKDKPKETEQNNNDTANNDNSSSSTSNDSNEEDVVSNTKKDKPKKDVPSNGNTSNEESSSNSNSESNSNTNSNTNTSSGNSNNSDSGSDILVDDTSYENDYPIDTKVNKIYIDEDLTIKIGNGIGSREVKETPQMLIFSDYNGEVVVDICVNRIGKVVKTQLNETKSTIKTKSLVSLALRKSEEFWFARTDRKEHCGTITFVIRAGNE